MKNFTDFTEDMKVKQDQDIKDREGTQPAKYYAGDMSKATKQARARHFEKKKSGPAYSQLVVGPRRQIQIYHMKVSSILN